MRHEITRDASPHFAFSSENFRFSTKARYVNDVHFVSASATITHAALYEASHPQPCCTTGIRGLSCPKDKRIISKNHSLRGRDGAGTRARGWRVPSRRQFIDSMPNWLTPDCSLRSFRRSRDRDRSRASRRSSPQPSQGGDHPTKILRACSCTRPEGVVRKIFIGSALLLWCDFGVPPIPLISGHIAPPKILRDRSARRASGKRTMFLRRTNTQKLRAIRQPRPTRPLRSGIVEADVAFRAAPRLKLRGTTH